MLHVRSGLRKGDNEKYTKGVKNLALAGWKCFMGPPGAGDTRPRDQLAETAAHIHRR